MFFQFSSEKVVKMFILTAVFLGAIIGLIYINKKMEVSQALKLYAAKLNKDASYWISNKLADSINPTRPSFFLWKVTGYKSEAEKPQTAGTARSIPVLAYHGLPNEGIGQLPNNVFIDQLKTLKENGWTTVSLEQFSEFIKGNAELPAKSFLLTFDDGRKDTFYPADPVLRDLGFRAVVFAISKRSLFQESKDSTYYLSAYELAQMEKTGRWEVESHGRDSHDWYYVDPAKTLGHFFSDKLWIETQNRMETDQEFYDRVTYDLSSSKKELEAGLKKTITAISFPFGDYGQDSLHYPEAASIVKTEAAKLYNLGFYQVRKGETETFNYPEGEFLIKRIEPTSDWTGKYLLSVMESGIAKDLPYSSSTFGPEWRSTWGQADSGNSLALAAAEKTTGSSSALDGSYLWRNYTFTVDTEWKQGNNIVLVARQNTDGDYFGCNFGPTEVAIKSAMNGSSRNLMKKEYSPGKFPRNLSLGIEVIGNDVGCFVNGEKVIEGIGINQSLPNGGIGIEVWDEHPGKADAVFRNISVIGH